MIGTYQPVFGAAAVDGGGGGSSSDDNNDFLGEKINIIQSTEILLDATSFI
jgi:hypothetical protein